MKIKKVYLGRKQIYPDGWSPGENTIAYYPLNSTSTVNDMSGNNNTLTNSGGVTFGTYGGVNCANTAGKSLYGAITNLPTGASARTILVWANAQAGSSWMTIYGYGANSTAKRFVLYRTTVNGGTLCFTNYGSGDYDKYSTTTMDTNKWYLVAYTYDGTTTKGYVNGNMECSATVSLNTTSSDFVISGWQAGYETFNGYISNVIIENKARTAQEISDYYNLTKGNYGL